MAEVAGEAWRLEYARAWAAACEVVSGAMLKRAAAAELEAEAAPGGGYGRAVPSDSRAGLGS
jgi:hypothetical protein